MVKEFGKVMAKNKVAPFFPDTVYCLPVPVFHFWPKLAHPAARSLCDSWAFCCTLCLRTNRTA